MPGQPKTIHDNEIGFKSTPNPKIFPSHHLLRVGRVVQRCLTQAQSGAGDGNRTHGSSLGSLGITIIRRPRSVDSSRPRERMANSWVRKAKGATVAPLADSASLDAEPPLRKPSTSRPRAVTGR